jgi:DNA-binding HxlR family transcriptional regulator
MVAERKSYPQYCAMARGLEVVGQRWTLLMVRELLLGPKRYKDLMDGLPGIPTNLLVERLRDLESQGVIARRKLPPPAGSVVYDLTDLGRQLEPLVLELGRWGANFLASPRPDDTFRPGWYILSMVATFRSEAARNLRETYEFRIDEDAFEIRVADGSIEANQGEARDPDLVVTAGLQTLLGILGGTLSPDDALASGQAVIDGDPSVFARSIGLLKWPLPAESAHE